MICNRLQCYRRFVVKAILQTFISSCPKSHLISRKKRILSFINFDRHVNWNKKLLKDNSVNKCCLTSSARHFHFETRKNGSLGIQKSKKCQKNITPSRSYHTAMAQYGRSSPLSDPENKGKRQLGVNFDTLGSWNNRISMPIMMEESIKRGKLIPQIPLQEIGTASLIGRRNRNEDRLKIQTLTSEILCFSIFDGHSSSVAVDYVSEHMAEHLRYWLTKTTDLNEVLHQSFININNILARYLYFYNIDSDDFHSGTTATVCLLKHGIELVVGHVGDTRAILCREGNAIRITEDHNPDDEPEKARITAKGGVVANNSLGVAQVNGRLSMSRSIGDMDLKSHGVTAEPYIHSIMVEHGKDAFLILTSDGLSFVLSDQEMVDIVCSCPTPKDAARLITDQALQFGSEDNATSVVVPLGAWGKYRTTSRAIPYSFGRNLVTGRFS